MRIYCDGIFDLFHKGHFNHFKKIHELFNESIHLIVGVISDNVSRNYKRLPIMNEQQRLKMVLSTKYVDEAFITDTLIIDENFLNQQKIDKVVHAFADKSDKNKQDLFHEVPIKLGKFIEIDYNDGISTTNLINDYFTDDLDVNNNNNYNFDQIISKLQIEKNDKIIEYGCGLGLLSIFFQEYDYYGLESSAKSSYQLIRKMKNIVFNFDLMDNIFKNEYFDFVILNGLQNNLLNEIERISKKGIYIININDDEIVNKLNYIIIKSVYGDDKKDAYKIK